MGSDEDEEPFGELIGDLNELENIHQLNLNPITSNVTPRATTLIRSISN